MATTSMDSPKPDLDTNTELDANPNLNPNPNSSNSLVPTSSNGPDVCLLKFAGDSAGGAFMGSIFREIDVKFNQVLQMLLIANEADSVSTTMEECLVSSCGVLLGRKLLSA